MAIKIMKGDLLTTDATYICHQVNCQGKMRSGVAKQIREKYPKVFDSYTKFLEREGSPEKALGHIDLVLCPDKKIVLNMFAQLKYGYDGKQYTNHKAFELCLVEIKRLIPKNEVIAMPYKIGCGLGGGDWDIIKNSIEDILRDYTVELWRLEE